MKKLHDLTHETKIILHKFERVLPQKEEVLADKILAPPHTDSEDEEPVVKRKRGSRNIIFDDEDCTKFIMRTKYGTWRPNRTWNEHKKTNFAFMKQIANTGVTGQQNDPEEKQEELEEEGGAEVEPDKTVYWPKYIPMKFDLQGNTVKAVLTKDGQQRDKTMELG